MVRFTLSPWVLPILVVLLALADAILHLSLDFVLFRGNLFGTLGPPPGAPAPPGPAAGGPPRLPLPLNQLFVINFVAYLVLALAFWFGTHRFGRRSWLLNVLLILYVAGVFIAWWSFGRPNPMGLGYLSKSIEILLIAVLGTHMWTLLSRPRAVPRG